MAIVARAGARKTLSAQVVEALRRQIEEGDYAPGDKLPAEPVLVGERRTWLAERPVTYVRMVHPRSHRLTSLL